MKSFAAFFRSSLAIAGIVWGLCARAEIEFVGVLATSRATHLALSDTATGRTAWIECGAVFSGWKVISYEAKDDTILLRRDNEERRVRIKDDAKIQNSRLELTGEITLRGGEATRISRATLLFDQENVFPLSDGLTYRITPTRLPDGNLRYAIVIESRDAAGKAVLISSPRVIVIPGQPFSLQVGDYGFSFHPKSP